jgi:hypothetical protein
MCSFLVENCTLAKTESQSEISNQNQQIFLSQNAFFEKSCDQNKIGLLFGDSAYFSDVKPLSECWGSFFCG